MRSTLDIPQRPFGRTGIPVSILAFGLHLGVPRTDQEAIRRLHAALDAGVTFLDDAWDYNDGLSEARMGKGLHGRRDQAFLMTKVCTHGPRRAGGDAPARSRCANGRFPRTGSSRGAPRGHRDRRGRARRRRPCRLALKEAAWRS
jgi:aryl-alcohol dehydrogenase-like predicted oxidoreductase